MVETSERRRQAVIDQYEQLLADRADDDETATRESESKSRSPAGAIGRPIAAPVLSLPAHDFL